MPTFTFQDIFKSSFLERLDAVSPAGRRHRPGAGLLPGPVHLPGLQEMLRRRHVRPSFGVTLIALTLITTLLILAVTSNIVLSLGMVGALSIVRFRTAHQGAHGHRFFILGHRGGHRAGGGAHPPGGGGQPLCGGGAVGVLPAEERGVPPTSW